MKDCCINYFKNTRKYLVAVCKTSLPAFRCTRRNPINKYIWFICYILYLLPNLFWLRIYSNKGKSNAEKFSKSATRTCKFRSNKKICHWTPLLIFNGIIHYRNSSDINQINFSSCFVKIQYQKGKFWKIREWPNRELECSRGNFKLPLLSQC